jgi:hypothetical protein
MVPGHFEARDTGISLKDVVAALAKGQAEYGAQLQIIINE